MAAELKKEIGVDAELVVGSSGEFTVWLDDKKVVDKAGGRFPTPEDVVAALRGAHAA